MNAWSEYLEICGRLDRSRVLCGDVTEMLYELEPESVDVVIADPPYFISRKGGTTCRGGKSVSVVKGAWDMPRSRAAQVAFSVVWLAAVRRLMRATATLWVCGVSPSIRAVSAAADAIGMPEINEVTWTKPNPPPNLACRNLTHSTERLLWLKREPRAPYFFAYEEARAANNDRQMRDVWEGGPPVGDERHRGGKHSAQKPEWLVRRCLEISCPTPDYIAKLGSRHPPVVLDLFAGSGTTSAVAQSMGLHSIAIEGDPNYCALIRSRLGLPPEAP